MILDTTPRKRPAISSWRRVDQVGPAPYVLTCNLPTLDDTTVAAASSRAAALTTNEDHAPYAPLDAAQVAEFAVLMPALDQREYERQEATQDASDDDEPCDCPICTLRYNGRLCAACAADYESWDDERTRAAAAFEAMTPNQFERWQSEQEAEYAARWDAGAYHD
jgi:hypothetical protein